jgi:hypothetical protein
MVVMRTVVVATESAVVKMINASAVKGVDAAPLMKASETPAPMEGASTTVKTANASTTKTAVLCQRGQCADENGDDSYRKNVRENGLFEHISSLPIKVHIALLRFVAPARV